MRFMVLRVMPEQHSLYPVDQHTSSHCCPLMILGTTRPPRPEERDGVDYQFLGVEQFLALEKSGQLIESGMYKGEFRSFFHHV